MPSTLTGVRMVQTLKDNSMNVCILFVQSSLDGSRASQFVKSDMDVGYAAEVLYRDQLHLTGII